MISSIRATKTTYRWPTPVLPVRLRTYLLPRKSYGRRSRLCVSEELNGNIQMYTKSGAGGAMPIATGQCGSGIFYIVDALDISSKATPS